MIPTLEELMAKYREVMGQDLGFDVPGARFTLRIWDGMDGVWTDCEYTHPKAVNGTAEDTLRAWWEETSGGTKKIRFSEIDYYRIFHADTKMEWSGDKEMFR